MIKTSNYSIIARLEGDHRSPSIYSIGKEQAMIYLDYAANTPASKIALDKFIEIEENYPFNPSSNNSLAKEAKMCFDQSVDVIGDILGVTGSEVIMTSSATESNNLLIKGIAKHYKGKGRHIITSFLEHSSVNGPIASLVQEGYDVDYVNIDSKGQIDLEHLKELLRPDTILVAICHVDSEIGLIQKVNEIGRFVKENSNSYFHVDGTQALGKIKVSLDFIDSYSFAAHKFYGINGCGGLVLRKGIIIEPLHHGGISDSIFRSGTPALGLTVSSSATLSDCIENLTERYDYVMSLNTKIKKSLEAYSLLKFNSNEFSSPYIINMSFTKIKGEDIKNRLADVGVCVSTKSACSAVFAPSRSVYALTKDKKAARSTLRVSLSHNTSLDEVDEFLEKFHRVYEDLSQ